MENLFIVLRIFGDISILLLYFLHFKKLSRALPFSILPIIFLYDILSCIALYSLKVTGVLEDVVYILFTVVEFICFSTFIISQIANKKAKTILQLIAVTFLLFIVVFESITKAGTLDSVAVGIEIVLIFIFSIFYLFEQLKHTTNLFITDNPSFWVITGFLVYLGGSFFIYILANQIDPDTLNKYWFLTNAFYFIGCCLVLLGVVLQTKRANKKPIHNFNASLN